MSLKLAATAICLSSITLANASTADANLGGQTTIPAANGGQAPALAASESQAGSRRQNRDDQTGTSHSKSENAPSANDVSGSSITNQPTEPNELAEITVTATRRAENIDKVPINIAAFTPEALEKSEVKTVADLSALTPGVEFDPSAGFGPNTLTNIAIRGINSTLGQSTVGVYLDDVPIQARVVGLSSFGNPFPLTFDVERVEVDRGPQGTLFGAGAEGGAIRFVSPPPGLRVTTGFARGEVSFTQDGAPSSEVGVAVGGPIVDGKLGYRVSAWIRKDGGYVDRVDPFTGATVDRNANWTRSYVLHGAMAFAPNEWLTITPSIFDQYIHNNDSNAYFESLSDLGQGELINGRLLPQPSNDRFYLPSLKIEVKLENFTITSVSAYFNRRGELTGDVTSYLGANLGSIVPYGNPMGIEYPASYDDAAPLFATTHVNLLTQELRASSNSPRATFRWTVGGFFSTASQTDTARFVSPFYSVQLFGNAPSDPLTDQSITSRDRQIAVFAQVDYRLLPRLTLTAGVRVSRTRAAFSQHQAGPLAGTLFLDTSGAEHDTPVVPKVGLSYEINDSDLVYASVGKGYRMGGANPPIPLYSSSNPGGCVLPAEPGPYSPDDVWSYEVGTKDRLFNARFHLDASMFYIVWNNIQQQISLNSCINSFTANAGRGISKGFDLATLYAPIDSLRLGLSVTYTDARLASDVTLFGSPIAQAGDALNSPLTGVIAPWSGTASIEYDIPAFEHTLTLRAEDIYHSHNSWPLSSQIPSSVTYFPDLPANPATNVLNLRATVTLDSLQMSVFADNALNSHPALYRYQDTATSLLFTDTTFRPRTFGVAATYRF